MHQVVLPLFLACRNALHCSWPVFFGNGAGSLSFLLLPKQRSMPVSLESTVKSINNRIDSLLFCNQETNKFQPKTCVVCDRLIRKGTGECTVTVNFLQKHADIIKKTFEDTFSENHGNNVDLRQKLLTDYKFAHDSVVDSLANIPLSPHACCNSSKKSFLACINCKNSLSRHSVPQFSIANGFFFGEAPNVLAELNFMEFALFSPTRTHGNLFTFHGGIGGMRGWHTIFQVDMKHLSTSLLHLDLMKANNNMAVLLTGPFTRNKKNHSGEDCFQA